MPISEAGIISVLPESARRQSLTRAACLALLAPGGHGRVAATMRAVPVIIPVRFALAGDDVVFSPGPGEHLVRAVANSVVAFETDHVGPDGLASWGVHVTGVATTMATQEGREARFRLSCDVLSGWRGES